MKVTQLVLSVGVAIAILTVGLAQPVLAEAIHHWKFDGDLTDSIGSADGTAVGDAAAGTANGVAGGAVAFDGSNDAVILDESILGPGECTFAFWSKDISSSNAYLMFDSGEPAWNIYLNRQAYDRYAMGLNNSGTKAFMCSNNTWHHLGFVIKTEEGNQKLKVYIDGDFYQAFSIYDGDPGDSPTFVGLRGDLWLGNKSDQTRDLNGLIDDFQVYDAPLDAADIEWLYDNPGQTVSEIPEPAATIMLLALMLGCFALRRRV